MVTPSTIPRTKLRTHDAVASRNSLATIAKRTGICRSHLFRIFDGSRVPSLPVAWKLANALRISLDELYNRLQKVKARRLAKHPSQSTSEEISAP